MKLLSLFSGIGAFEKALDRLSINYQLVNYCEIDKYASKSYAAIHGVPESMNLGDITKVDEKALPKDIDLITYGFPCQDISISGKQKGLFNEDGSKTRSGLFFEALRIIEETQPKVAMAENVKNLTSKKFNAQFQIVLASLEAAGYNNYWQVVNAKDYGVPQNRERVFIVSIRKDIDTGEFKFPEGFPLELRLKDLLEDEVDEKFYLSEKALQGIKNSTFDRKKHIVQEKDWCDTLLSRDYKDPKCVEVERTGKNGESIVSHIQMETDDPKESAIKLGNVYSDKFNINSGSDFGGNVWDTNGLAPTLKTTAAASQQFVFVKEATKLGYAEAYEGDSINLDQPNSTTRRGRVGHGVAQTLTTSCNQAVVEPSIEVLGNYSPSGHDASRIVSEDGIAPTVKENHGTVTAVAMRGRYAEDGTVEQNIEVSDREYANALTTVQKDSMVAETPVGSNLDKYYLSDAMKEYIAKQGTGTFRNPDCKINLEVARPLTTDQGKRVGTTNYISGDVGEEFNLTPENVKPLRIRKLTPKECFRLMDFDDEDFDKAEAVNSNTQLYKQAGNSIVVACPYYIIKALIEANIFIERENKEMEMKVSEYQLPEKISFNFEELKMELTAKVSMYETMVYTEENIKDAKADRANLNKLKKALNDERIRREKEYMVPFNEFKAQIAEIISIIDKPCMVIDQQVKAFEDKQKQDKLDEITDFFNSTEHPDWLHLSQIMNEKWLNASASMKSAQEEINARLEQITTDMATLSNLPEFGFEAVEVYKSSLDMNKAISEAQRMSQIQKAKAEAEAKKAEPTEPQPTSAPEGFMNPPVEDKPKQWIKFQAYMTVDDAFALKKFFNDRGIEYKAV